MGQKRGRFGRVTGATLRRLPGKFLLSKFYSIERGLITKRVVPNLTHRQRLAQVYLDEESQDVLKQFESQFDDGGIEVGNGFNRCYSVPYSLNKLRRWELPNLLKDNIVCDSSHETNEFEVVLVERSIGFYGSFSTDCVGIHKSKGNIRSKAPRGKYAEERNLYEVEQNARVSSLHRNSGNHKKPKVKVEVEKSTPLTQLKYEVTYERPWEQYPNFMPRNYNRHSRDLGKVEIRLPQKEIHKMHNLEFDEDDESYYSDHFDTDDGYLGDEESMIYFHDPEFSMGPPPPSFADYLDFSKKPVQRKPKKKSKKSLTVEETEYSKKDRKVLIRSPDVPTTSIETSVADAMVTTPSLAPLIPTSHLINITKSSASPECLETVFKSCYTEGASLPRRFLIDVTSHLHHLLQKQGKYKAVEHVERSGHKIVLIFVKNNEETESFVNYSWKKNSEESLNEVNEFRIHLFGFDDEVHNQYGNLLVNYLNDSRSFSVTDVVAIVKTVMEQLPISQFDADKKIPTDQMSHLAFKALQNHLQQVSEVMTPYDLYQKNVMKETPKILNTPHVKPGTCNICDIDLLPSTGGRFATSLNVCQHWFCDDCWRHHIHTRVGRGDFSILCPEYKCDNKLDVPTLMSLLSTKTFQNHVTHRQNRMVDSDPSWHWCPEPSCGHVGRVCQSKDELGFISCNCGKSWCVGCKADVHWPAFCQQAEEYVKTIKKREEDKKSQKITSVQVKRCPHCGRVMEKNGGCPNMTCVCGNHFCWVCLKPHYYTSACSKSAKTLETIELYPVLLGVTKDELLSKATNFRKFTSKSVFERIKRNVVRLLMMMHSKTIRQNSGSQKPGVKNNLPVEKRICSWCSNEEHMKMYTEAVEMAQEVAEFYTETYHLLEWTFVLMAYLKHNRMLRVVSKQLGKLIFILEMLDEISITRITISQMKETKLALTNLLSNGRKWRNIVYHSAHIERTRNMEEK